MYLNNKTWTIIGIMTGTSIDSVDIAVVKFSQSMIINSFLEPDFEIIATKTYPFPDGFKEEILQLSSLPVLIKRVSQANFRLTELYAEAINFVLCDNNISIESVDGVAIHGQTIWHNPLKENYFDANIASTLQLGNCSALSALLNMPIISDFRSADIAVGGQGAPLVPLFDYYFLKQNGKYVVALNIGGISNITIIPNDAKIDDVIAFDTGPGNILIDAFVRKLFNKKFDMDGAIARNGNVFQPLSNELLLLDYYSKKPPKSTGREQFNEFYVNNILDKFSQKIKNADLIRTLTELTAITISNEVNSLSASSIELIVKGGGTNNMFLMELLKKYLKSSVNIKKADEIGISSDYYEAIAFAFLGLLTIHSIPSNMPNVTGAKKAVVLGSISRNFSQ